MKTKLRMVNVAHGHEDEEHILIVGGISLDRERHVPIKTEDMKSDDFIRDAQQVYDTLQALPSGTMDRVLAKLINQRIFDCQGRTREYGDEHWLKAQAWIDAADALYVDAHGNEKETGGK